ncbi:MAG: L-lactate permease [Ancrocorticia sp.]|jgi:lactate permease|nr:L-lactate permease [Ancrocorticia sp.]MCI1962768.1 L-lactate permease [Ancrocorticia sp.]MCI2001952.1 L-lactate permease [Ancrocorticia sp.]MCI2012409.1 L-lactate permease [Ancrocorticia sp.]MCI2029169.1 L-lactate permease [Ancrocorticia sp.]
MITADLFTPSVTALSSSLLLSAIVAVIPLLAFFVMLGVFKIPTHWCALISLAVSIVIAVVGFKMPAHLALLSATQGAFFGLFPILFIVIMAVWLYNLTERSGRSEDVRTVFAIVGHGDVRLQALLIGFSFCGLLEGLAGFGAPVAIASAMLLAVGLPPLKAALAAIVGNALNVGFGAMAIPVTTAGQLGGIAPESVAATMGRITPLLISWTPLLILGIIDGKRGIKQAWPAALVAGVGMAAGHFIGSQFLPYQLTAVFASLLSFALLAGFLQVWHISETPQEHRSQQTEGGLTASRVVLGLMPYWLVVVIFAFAKLWKIGWDLPALLSSTDIAIAWPGLDGNIADTLGNVSNSTVLNFQWLSSPGTMLLITGLIVSISYGAISSGGRFPFSFGKGIATLGKTVRDLRIAILTICTIMALAYVMNLSGQTVTIGTWLAETGAAFAFVAPLLGWIGTAVTGSATSAAALFANLQAVAATQAHLPPSLLLAANEIGGGIGKIISPQNLAIAASAIREPGSESKLLRKALPYSVVLIVLLGIITFLASRGILGFLVVS